MKESWISCEWPWILLGMGEFMSVGVELYLTIIFTCLTLLHCTRI